MALLAGVFALALIFDPQGSLYNTGSSRCGSFPSTYWPVGVWRRR